MKSLAIAGALLLLNANIALADKAVTPPEPVVNPDAVYDHQAFSFAVITDLKNAKKPDAVVVNVQTVEGVVVQQSSTDKYGRVFLAAGLPAGAYLISSGSHSKPLGKLEIHQRAADAVMHQAQPMQLLNPPPALKISDRFTLSGQGFSPNFFDMHVTLEGCGQAPPPLVLAATEDQLKLAPLQQPQPGACQLRVINQATGQSTGPLPVLLYDIQGHMERRKLKSGGDQTQLVVIVKPENLPLKVKAVVVSGPVDFGDGRKETESVTNNGRAVFPVRAEHGAGPFQLSWELATETLKPANADSH